jgi:hypothetical protein
MSKFKKGDKVYHVSSPIWGLEPMTVLKSSRGKDEPRRALVDHPTQGTLWTHHDNLCKVSDMDRNRRELTEYLNMLETQAEEITYVLFGGDDE